jgi:hypothetical protein
MALAGTLGAALAFSRGRPVLGCAGILVVCPYVRFRLCAEPIAGSRSATLKFLLPQLAIDLSELGVIVSTRARLRWNEAAAGVRRGIMA